LVNLLGGEVSLESTPGVGSEFKVRMKFAVATPQSLQGNPASPPEVTDDRDTADAVPPATEGGLNGIRVLVVDDSDINLDVIKRILEIAGAKVAVASNGLEAFQRLQMHPLDFDVVLMDVQMPVLDGHTATRRIRVDLGMVDLPVIALTAGALSSERQRALSVGMDDFLVKPFDIQTLQTTILRHVSVASLHAATPIEVDHGPAPASAPHWPEIDGIHSATARSRLSNDLGLLLSALTRLLTEFADLTAGVDPLHSPPGEFAARMHKLKGIAGMLGAPEIHRLAAEAESACRNGDPGVSARLIANLQIEMEKLQKSATPVLQAARIEADAVIPSSAVSLAPHLLAELVELLGQQNLAAQNYFATLTPQLRQHLGKIQFEILRDHINNLAFGDAVSLLTGDNPGRVANGSR
jgi:CheY-like chemotaxis protein